MKYALYLKIWGVFLGVTLGAAYVTFSYKQTSKTLQNETQELWSQTKEDVSKACQNLQHYVSLIETLLQHAIHNNKDISQVLSWKAENLMQEKFPEIMSVHFTLASHPPIFYTRFGKAKGHSTVEADKEGFSSLGKGLFKVRKTLYDKKQKTLGKLELTFSIAPFLYKHFSADKLLIFPHIPKKAAYFFTVSNFPYVFVLNQESFSFKEFLCEYTLQILSSLAFGLFALVVGLIAGGLFRYKSVLKSRSLTQSFKKEKIHLSNQLVTAQALADLKETSKKASFLLMSDLQNRYRHMASQAQSINTVTSKLIAEASGNNKSLKNIHQVSQESTAILRWLANGYPMKETEEYTHLLPSLETIKTIFLPEIKERDIRFEIKGKANIPLSIDRLTFELVLHNIFHIIMGRLNKKNLFKITIKENTHIDLIFYDNGYNIKTTTSKFLNHETPENILFLERNKLRALIACLGWELFFQSERGPLNSIKLSIPRIFQEKRAADNVVNLLDFRSF